MKYKLEELFDLQMGKTPSRNNPEYWASNDHKETEYVPVEYPPTSEILADLKTLQEEINKGITELEEMLHE